jgi:hypothetical protein
MKFRSLSQEFLLYFSLTLAYLALQGWEESSRQNNGAVHIWKIGRKFPIHRKPPFYLHCYPKSLETGF